METNYLKSDDSALYSGMTQTEIVSSLMRKVYLWMALALTVTGITAFGVAGSSAVVLRFLFQPIVYFSITGIQLLLVFGITKMTGGMGAVFGKSKKDSKAEMSITLATILFIVYSILNGVVFSVLLLVYTMESITSVFLITAATFGLMATWGYMTEKDLSSIGSYLIFALLGIVIATVVNLFLDSSTLHMIISYVGVLVFVGLTAYDTSQIKKALNTVENPEVEGQKVALMGALSLYLDFVNLFIYILSILGRRK